MSGRIVIVGLGPGDPAQLSVEAAEAIARIPRQFIRTTRHPSAGAVPGATSFDDLYERAGTLEDVYQGIVGALVEAAAGSDDVLYAVPGSPLVAERSVELLRGDPRAAVDVIPGLSFLDLAWVRLGVDPLAAG